MARQSLDPDAYVQEALAQGPVRVPDTPEGLESVQETSEGSDSAEDSASCTSPSSSSSPSKKCDGQRTRNLGTCGICMIAYFNVCGGGFGSEGAISDCGPLIAFVGMLVFMLFWGLPVVLVTSELSSAYPVDGGYSIWVAEAFGEFWGLQESYLSWTSGVVDNALYPVLAYQTAVRIWGGAWGDPLPDEDSKLEGWDTTAYFIKLSLVVIFSLPNYLSTKSFSMSLGFAFVLVVAPFCVFSVCSLANAHATTGSAKWSRLLEVGEDLGWDSWTDLCDTLYWNWSGFDCVSTVAGEVINPHRSYIRGLLLAMGLILVSYFVPLGAAVVNGTPSWQKWEAGWYTTLAKDQVGLWMASWMVISCFIGSFGQYTAELLEDSWQLAGMADAGMLPAAFGKKSRRFGTPWAAISFQVLVIGGLVAFDFSSILVVDNCFSVAGTVLELFAFLKLRYSQPELERPFRVPISNFWALCACMFAPICLGTTVFLSCFYGHGIMLPIINVVLLCCGPLFFLCLKRFAHTEYVHGE